MKHGYRMAQVGGFIVFGWALYMFLRIWRQPGFTPDEATAISASAGLCILMLAEICVGVGFFWGREKLLFYEYGMVYQKGKTKAYAYADIENILLEKRERYRRSQIVSYKLVGVVYYSNVSKLEITGEKLAGFPKKFMLWQQYLVWC